MVIVWKYPVANARSARVESSVYRLGRSPGEGNGIPLQYSCLENSMDRGACWAMVHGISESWTWLGSWVNTHTHTHTHNVYNWWFDILWDDYHNKLTHHHLIWWLYFKIFSYKFLESNVQHVNLVHNTILYTWILLRDHLSMKVNESSMIWFMVLEELIFDTGFSLILKIKYCR